MSATATEATQNAQEQTLKSIRQAQDAVVEVVRNWATAIDKNLPDAPALPFADQFPSPREIVETSFDFAEQLLKAQREFVEGLLDAAAPVFQGRSPAKKA